MGSGVGKGKSLEQVRCISFMVQLSNDNKRHLINSYSFPCPEPVTHAHMRILPEFMSIYDNASNMNFYFSSFVNERYTLFCTLIYFTFSIYLGNYDGFTCELGYL